MPRIVQLTDCHLFSDSAAELRGVATWPRFLAVVEDLKERAVEFDLLVLTGDTAQDEEPTTYEAVREVLSPWSDRLRIIPGNHDNRAAISAAFPEADVPIEGLVSFHQHCGAWQFVGLDTQLPGQVSGAVSDQQLVWLHRLLQENPAADVALCMHHPPVSVGSHWLDQIGLEDVDSFSEWLGHHPQIRLILCGHVHHATSASLHSATVVTTPAVGPQFRPRTSNVELQPGLPGYRFIELSEDSRWSSQIVFVE